MVKHDFMEAFDKDLARQGNPQDGGAGATSPATATRPTSTGCCARCNVLAGQCTLRL